jgi:hypothetical protein
MGAQGAQQPKTAVFCPGQCARIESEGKAQAAEHSVLIDEHYRRFNELCAMLERKVRGLREGQQGARSSLAHQYSILIAAGTEDVLLRSGFADHTA